jgi:hypothetical protein
LKFSDAMHASDAVSRALRVRHNMCQPSASRSQSRRERP